MTRKDFELIASTIAALPLDDDDRTTVAVEFAHALSKTRFAFERFVLAAMKGQS